jgi:hypothetical protein
MTDYRGAGLAELCFLHHAGLTGIVLVSLSTIQNFLSTEIVLSLTSFMKGENWFLYQFDESPQIYQCLLLSSFGKWRFKPLYHRERILETSTLSCNEEEEEITKPPKR